MENAYSNTSRLGDEELVLGFRKFSENQYLEELFNRYKQKVYLISLRFLQNKSLAEDVTQETFIKAIDSIRSGNYREENFSAWIGYVARNLCIDKIRQQKRELRGESELRQKTEATPVMIDNRAYNQAELTVLSKEAIEMIDKLETEQRTCFLLKYTEGYSYEDIVDKTGYSLKEVKTYLQNGRRNFLTRWQEKKRGGKEYGT